MIDDQSPKIKPTRRRRRGPPRSNPAQRPSSTGPVNGHVAGARFIPLHLRERKRVSTGLIAISGPSTSTTVFGLCHVRP